MSTRKIDIEIQNGGTIVLFRPLSKAGVAWIEENVQSEGWQWFGNALAVEHRYADDLAEGIREAGLVIE